jgi:hypothetical protein
MVHAQTRPAWEPQMVKFVKIIKNAISDIPAEEMRQFLKLNTAFLYSNKVSHAWKITTAFILMDVITRLV